MTTGLAIPTATSPRTVYAGLAVWLVLALLLSLNGTFAGLGFPGAQLIILALVAFAIFAVTAIRPVRAWLDSLSVNTLIGFHAMRLVGVVFVVLGARGQLAPSFANRAGWGDVAAALMAIALVAAPALRTRWTLNAWNAFGLLDLTVAVGTATAVVISGQTPGMQPILTLPLSLVPLFFVPVLVALHIALFRRINGR